MVALYLAVEPWLLWYWCALALGGFSLARRVFYPRNMRNATLVAVCSGMIGSGNLAIYFAVQIALGLGTLISPAMLVLCTYVTYRGQQNFVRVNRENGLGRSVL